MQKIIRIIRLISFVVILLFNLYYLFAGETGKIAGIITDANTEVPLMGANIIITAVWMDGREQEIEFTQGAVSDLDGRYFILNVRLGTYSLKVNFIGYGNQLRTQVIVYVDKTTQVVFQLTLEALEGETVTVIAQKPNAVEVDLTATKQIYKVEDIQSIAGVTDLESLFLIHRIHLFQIKQKNYYRTAYFT